jgi:AcrR family transcriptional regulator
MSDVAGKGARGRPRSERARLAILAATADLLLEGGMSAATMERIAARAGVSKVTIYRWWPSRGHLMLDSFLARIRDTVAVPADTPLAATLTGHVEALCALLRNPEAGPVLRELFGAAQSDPEIAALVDERWVRPRKAMAVAALENGIRRGELRADLDVDAAVDQLFGPVYFRLFFGHAPLHEGLAAILVEQALTGLRP